MSNRITSLTADGLNAIVTIDTATTSAKIASAFTLDPTYAIALDDINGLDAGQPLPPGETISIPINYLKESVLNQIYTQQALGNPVNADATYGGFTLKQLAFGGAGAFALFWLMGRGHGAR